VEQVLLTDVVKIHDRLLALAQLPRTHRLYNDSNRFGYDLLLLSEAARQASEAITHRLMGVPQGRRFVMATMQVKLLNREAAAVTRAPTEVLSELLVKKVKQHPDGTPHQIEGSTLCYIKGVLVAEFTGMLMILQEDEYQAFRCRRAGNSQALGPSAVDRLAPEQVGKYDPRNVVIGGLRIAGNRIAADLVVDPDDPVFFDHELDHFPAMLILESARQSALVAWARRNGVVPRSLVTVAYSARFLKFTEFNAPVTCSAVPDGTSAVTFEILQDRDLIADGEISLALA